MIDDAIAYNDAVESLFYDESIYLRDSLTGNYVHGYIRYAYCSLDDENHDVFISIYCFSSRKEVLYFLSLDMKLVPISEHTSLLEVDNTDLVIILSNESKIYKKFNSFFKNIILVFLIFSTLFYGVYFPQNYSKRSYIPYYEFLHNDYSIKNLVTVVLKQIQYIPDYNELWHHPEFAWRNRSGDCEEFAFVIADYLNNNGYTAYITGVMIPNVGGHAIVLAFNQDNKWLIDPLGTLIPQKILRYDNNESWKNIINKHCYNNIEFYQIPSFNGEKILINKPLLF